ncbi:MAG: hypothetical protein ACXWW6_06115, partial [Candidatus Limnocylindrales bacterium]
GDMAVHARQRTGLGRGATARVVGLNLGVVLAVLGGAIAWTPPILVGLVLVISSIVASLSIFLDAMGTGVSGMLRPVPGRAREGG